MMDVIVNGFIYLLAVCGAIYLVVSVLKTFNTRDEAKGSRAGLVLIVRNQQNMVEGLVRNFYRENFLGRLMHNAKITIIDMGSMDETPAILEKLQKEYEDLQVLGETEKYKIFEYFEGKSE